MPNLGKAYFLSVNIGGGGLKDDIRPVVRMFKICDSCPRFPSSEISGSISQQYQKSTLLLQNLSNKNQCTQTKFPICSKTTKFRYEFEPK